MVKTQKHLSKLLLGLKQLLVDGILIQHHLSGVAQGLPGGSVVEPGVMHLVVLEHAFVVRSDQKILCFNNGIPRAK